MKAWTKGLLSGLNWHNRRACTTVRATCILLHSLISSIRVANLIDRQTALVAGPLTGSLFDFGDVDGGLGTGRLQHPLAVVGDENGLLCRRHLQ